MQANAILIHEMLHTHVWYPFKAHLCVNYNPHCERAKGGGGGGVNRHDRYWATHSSSWNIEVMH